MTEIRNDESVIGFSTAGLIKTNASEHLIVQVSIYPRLLAVSNSSRLYSPPEAAMAFFFKMVFSKPMVRDISVDMLSLSLTEYYSRTF